MANETITLRAKAKRLGIDGYKGMSPDELRQAIKSAEGKSGSSGRKTAAKSSANGRKSSGRKGTARKTAKSKVTKGTAKSSRKSASSAKSAPAKSTARKSSAKSGAAKGAKAKRQTSGTTKAKANGDVGRMAIDNASIDWKAESNVGASGGNRGDIMKLLRRYKGNVDKVFDALADNAQKMYPKTQDGKRRSKGEAQTLLRWHISRVKYDFAKDTGQHEGITRSKPAGRRQSATKPKGGKTTTRKSAGRQKAARGRGRPARKASASKAKTAASRKTAKGRKR